MNVTNINYPAAATTVYAEHDMLADDINHRLNSLTDPNRILKSIKNQVKDGINLVKKNIAQGLNGDLATLEKVSQLLNSPLIEADNLKIIDECDFGDNKGYTVTYENKKIFTLGSITSTNRRSSEDDFFINLDNNFNELYNRVYAPDYDVIDETTVENTTTYIANLV